MEEHGEARGSEEWEEMRNRGLVTMSSGAAASWTVGREEAGIQALVLEQRSSGIGRLGKTRKKGGACWWVLDQEGTGGMGIEGRRLACGCLRDGSGKIPRWKERPGGVAAQRWNGWDIS